MVEPEPDRGPAPGSSMSDKAPTESGSESQPLPPSAHVPAGTVACVLREVSAPREGRGLCMLSCWEPQRGGGGLPVGPTPARKPEAPPRRSSELLVFHPTSALEGDLCGTGVSFPRPGRGFSGCEAGSARTPRPGSAPWHLPSLHSRDAEALKTTLVF